MSDAADIWEALGIAPTSETREIKRGYARALKQIDVDAEPERFAALREAYDYAVWLAESDMVEADDAMAPAADEQVESDYRDQLWSGPPMAMPQVLDTSSTPDADPTDGTLHAVDTPTGSPLPPPNPWERAAIDLAARHAGELEAMLAAQYGKQIVALPAEAAVIRDHWHAVTKDPRMAEIGHYAAVETWISDIVASGCPFSDPVIPDVVDYFGWTEKAGMIGLSRAPQFLVDRRKSLDFLQSISNGTHPLHKAWNELTTPANEYSVRGTGVPRKKVVELLKVIRADHPHLEHQFDGRRIALWENGKSGFRLDIRFSISVILIAFYLLRLLGGSDSTPDSKTPLIIRVSDSLSTPRADIDRALKALSRNYVSGNEAETRNPAFYSDLQMIWDKVKSEKGNYGDFQASIGRSIAPRFDRVVGKAGYAPVATLRQVMLDQARYFRGQGPEQCAAYLTGQGTLTVTPPEKLAERYRRAVYDVLLDAGADRPNYKRPKSFLVPGPLVTAAARTAHMDRNTFSAAMNLKGTPGQLCDTNIALISEALKMPKKAGLPILRAL